MAARKDMHKHLEEKVKKGAIRRYDLTCIKDGAVTPFFDEGPFPTDEKGNEVEGWRVKDPSGRRQNLLKQLAKRDDDGFPIWAFCHRDAKGTIVPLGPLIDAKGNVQIANGLPVIGAEGVAVEIPEGPWHTILQNPFPVPYANAAWIEQHKKHLGERQQRVDGGAIRLNGEIKQLEEDAKKTGRKTAGSDKAPAA